jgi:hypothetical protein
MCIDMIKRPVADRSTFNSFYILGTRNKCPINIKSYQKDFFGCRPLANEKAREGVRLQARDHSVGVGDFYQGLVPHRLTAGLARARGPSLCGLKFWRTPEHRGIKRP